MPNPFIPDYVNPAISGAGLTSNQLAAGNAGSTGGIDWANLFGKNSGLGLNMDTLKLGLGGIQTIGNLWNSFQAQQLARDQFDFTKGMANTNLTNSIQSYNTALEDRIRARAAMEGRPDSYVTDYLDANRAVDTRRRQY